MIEIGKCEEPLTFNHLFFLSSCFNIYKTIEDIFDLISCFETSCEDFLVYNSLIAIFVWLIGWLTFYASLLINVVILVL